MGIGWVGLLKSVPWGDVVSNAPKIADGAKSLWNTVAKKVRPGDDANSAPAEEAPDASLVTRLAVLESGMSDLQRQIVTSSELIRSLAEQNTQLVARIDALQSRLRWLTGAFLVAVIVAFYWVLKA